LNRSARTFFWGRAGLEKLGKILFGSDAAVSTMQLFCAQTAFSYILQQSLIARQPCLLP
jgi:hypothetical protein